MLLENTTAKKINNWRDPPCYTHTLLQKTGSTQNASFMTLYQLTLPQVRNLIKSHFCLTFYYQMTCVHVHAYFCLTYFSISLFLQVRGAQEEEEEDEGVLGSVLLLSPLLVEGISVDTQAQVTWLPLSGGFSNYKLECNKHHSELLFMLGPCYSTNTIHKINLRICLRF